MGVLFGYFLLLWASWQHVFKQAVLWDGDSEVFPADSDSAAPGTDVQCNFLY